MRKGADIYIDILLKVKTRPLNLLFPKKTEFARPQKRKVNFGVPKRTKGAFTDGVILMIPSNKVGKRQFPFDKRPN